MDMESGTIAANGLRFRVPYGTLLCVSDKPLHGELKLPGMADRFYREHDQTAMTFPQRTKEHDRTKKRRAPLMDVGEPLVKASDFQESSCGSVLSVTLVVLHGRALQ